MTAEEREREEARCDACAAAWEFKDEGGKWCVYDFVPRLRIALAACEAQLAEAQADAERLYVAADDYLASRHVDGKERLLAALAAHEEVKRAD